MTTYIAFNTSIVIEDRKARTANRRLAKKRVQCLNEALCFVSSSVLADSLVLLNPLLRQAPKRYSAMLKTTVHTFNDLDKWLSDNSYFEDGHVLAIRENPLEIIVG